jgi:hypothetical protein
MGAACLRLSIGVAAAAMLAGLTLPALADRALVVGIDAYSDAKLVLGGKSSAHDAAAIASLLKDSLGYAPSDIKVLADGAASRAAILDAFNSWLVEGSKPGERVFFYFSGLGYFEADSGGAPKEGFVAADAVVGPGTPPAIANMISADEFHDLVKSLAGRKVTVVIDAGFSGIVSGGAAQPLKNNGSIRAVALGAKTRSIVVEPAAKEQKAAGAPLGAAGLGDNVAVFSAAAGGQAPVIADGQGAFTKAFVDAIKDKGADTNHDGVISNEKILTFVRDKTACADQTACPLGLTPTLEPASAVAGSPLSEGPAPAGKLTADQVLDFFAKGNTHGVALEMMPASPIKVGTRDIRFRVISPAEGNLVLLDLGDDGTLTQLFPNGHFKGGREGHILAGSPIVVPDDYYGVQFNATSPSSGTLIALVTTEPIKLPDAVKTRSIEVIPAEQATQVFLPAIAAALDKPADADKDTATRAVDWSVATLRYEMVR